MKKFLPLLLLFTLPNFAQAQFLFFHAGLNGAQAGDVTVGGTGSLGTGFADAILNTSTNVLTFSVTWTGLGSLTNNAHIHRGAPGVNGPVVVPFPNFPGLAGGPAGTLAGTYSNVFTLSDALEADLIAGLHYVNIHTVQFPAGEIRGQLVAVPEPSTYAISGAGLLALLVGGRIRRSRGA
jgi:hypothetical protein